jgi:hypothetical protein
VTAAHQLELLAGAGFALGLAILIGHEVTSKILAVVGTVLFGVVLAVLLLA